MTALRAALVNSITLPKLPAGLQCGDLMLLSKGEAKSLGKEAIYFSQRFWKPLSELFILSMDTKKLLNF